MTTYQIKRWDVVMFGNNITKVPMIYIIPDLYFLEFAKVNEYSLFCEISGTNTIYDGVIIPATVNKSSDVPNCRPNFYADTGTYVITLKMDWNGYPNRLGKVKFLAYKNPIPQNK